MRAGEGSIFIGGGVLGEEKTFEREVLDRLITIETTLRNLTVTCPQCQAELIAHGKAIVALDASTKSAHHRITSIYKIAGIVATIVSAVIGAIFTLVNFIIQRGVHP